MNKQIPYLFRQEHFDLEVYSPAVLRCGVSACKGEAVCINCHSHTIFYYSGFQNVVSFRGPQSLPIIPLYACAQLPVEWGGISFVSRRNWDVLFHIVFTLFFSLRNRDVLFYTVWLSLTFSIFSTGMRLVAWGTM